MPRARVVDPVTRPAGEVIEPAAVPVAESEVVAKVEASIPPEPPRFARADDLGPATTAERFEDVVLPSLGLTVRVRYLGTAEFARIRYVMDLTGLVEQMTQDAKAKGGASAKTGRPYGEWLAEQITFKARVAHFAVADPDQTEDPVECPWCEEKGRPVMHRPSLWSPEQCGGLSPADLERIEEVTAKAQALGFLDPSSAPTSPESSEPSPDSGA